MKKIFVLLFVVFLGVIFSGMTQTFAMNSGNISEKLVDSEKNLEKTLKGKKYKRIIDNFIVKLNIEKLKELSQRIDKVLATNTTLTGELKYLIEYLKYSTLYKLTYDTYSDNRISFEFPRTWALSEPKGMVQVLSPLGEGDFFIENINFISQNIEELGIDYNTYLKLNINFIKDMLAKNSGKIISEEDVKVSGRDAKKFVYEFTMQNTGIRTTQYFMLKGENTYLITITNSQEEPNEKAEDFSHILDTMKLK